jgi:predicted extracellular nuclease
VNGSSGPQLTFSPGRVDPTNAAFNASRKPLAGEFMYNGHQVFVIGNHFNSKGGDQPLFGRFQPPARVSEVQRHQQAQIVHDFVASILALDHDANVVVLGDLNDFDFSDTLTILRSGGVLLELMAGLPDNERYTYDFEGNSQALDHILVSPHLQSAAAPDYDIVHVNAEFADQASDHDPQLAKLTLPSFDSACDLARSLFEFGANPRVASGLT